MIEIICSRETYVYNVYHMVKAFYPLKEVTSRVEEKASNYITIYFHDESVPHRAAPAPKEHALRDARMSTFEISNNTVEETEDIKELKYRIDCALYRELSARTKRELAWGILMGVRPTKIAMKSLEDGMSKEAFVSWFQEHLLVSAEKAHLAWDIAVREKSLLDKLDTKDGYSLYIGIPFCPSVCSYCSFSSGALSDWKESVEDYLKALLKELGAVARLSGKKRLNTIYIGGGTPTTLDAVQLERLLAYVDEHFAREYLLEYTVEAGRPDSITREKLEVLKRHGVTRISINPQSMQQKTLDAIGRKHTVEEIYDSFRLAREVGFDNINMDIIAGLPGETASDMKDTLKQIQSLSPDNLTVHSLAIKRAAKMGQEKREEKGKEKEKEDQTAADVPQMIRDAAGAASDMDMSPYYLYRQKNIAGNFENVGYAKVDKAGIYNILIMEEKQSIIAVGAGASTKIVLDKPVENPANKKKKTCLIRLENVKAIDAYISRVDEMIERKEEWLWH